MTTLHKLSIMPLVQRTLTRIGVTGRSFDCKILDTLCELSDENLSQIQAAIKSTVEQLLDVRGNEDFADKNYSFLINLLAALDKLKERSLSEIAQSATIQHGFISVPDVDLPIELDSYGGEPAPIFKHLAVVVKNDEVHVYAPILGGKTRLLQNEIEQLASKNWDKTSPREYYIPKIMELICDLIEGLNTIGTKGTAAEGSNAIRTQRKCIDFIRWTLPQIDEHGISLPAPVCKKLNHALHMWIPSRDLDRILSHNRIAMRFLPQASV